MTAWKIWRDGGEWFVSEISETYANWESFATEAEAVDELRRLQTDDVLAAQKAVSLEIEKLRRKREILRAAPKVHRMKRRDTPQATDTKGDESP